MGLRLMRYVHNLPIINELYWGTEFKRKRKGCTQCTKLLLLQGLREVIVGSLTPIYWTG